MHTLGPSVRLLWMFSEVQSQPRDPSYAAWLRLGGSILHQDKATKAEQVTTSLPLSDTRETARRVLSI
jgi:hypothetical protein